MIHPLLKGRFLFTVDGCPHCREWHEFIHWVNYQLNWDKQIKIIDCTEFHDFGIIRDPIIKLFNPYVKGNYPTLFIDGEKKSGSNTPIESKTWIISRLFDDFYFEQENEELPNLKSTIMFNKKCEIRQSFFDKILNIKRAVCHNQGG